MNRLCFNAETVFTIDQWGGMGWWSRPISLSNMVGLKDRQTPIAIRLNSTG